MAEGYVYILFNPAFQRDQYKIGKTTKSPEIRAREISTGTGVPREFEVLYEERVKDCDRAEQLIHRRLHPYRSSANREFFELPLKSAIRIVSEVAGDVGRIEDEIASNNLLTTELDDNDMLALKDEISVVLPERRRNKSKPVARSPVTFEDHAAYTDAVRRQILDELRQHILVLDDRLRSGEVCTPGQRIGYKIPGDKIFLEIKVQRASIVLHLVDAGVPDPEGITSPIPETHGWGDLKKRIKLTSPEEAKHSLPFIEAAYRSRASA